MTEKLARERLRVCLEESGYKQRFVAKRAGWTDNKLSRILRGETRIALEDYFTLCRALQTDPRNLLGPEDGRGEPSC